jgi:hypothetical protein
MFPKPPLASRKALTKAIRHHLNAFSALSTESAVGTGKKFLLPHVAYFARLDHLRASVGLQYAKPVAWRYFVGSERDSVLALAEVNIERTRKNAFSSLRTSTQNRSHFKLLQKIANSGRQRGTFSFRLLRIPSLHVLAVWLKSPLKGRDLVVPLVPLGHVLIARRFYTRKEFERVVRDAAIARPESTANSN